MLKTSHRPESMSATRQPKKIAASCQIVVSLTFFLSLPRVPSALQRLTKYMMNARTRIAPSVRESPPPSVARTNGSMSASQRNSRSRVKMDCWMVILRQSSVRTPSANAA